MFCYFIFSKEPFNLSKNYLFKKFVKKLVVVFVLNFFYCLFLALCYYLIVLIKLKRVKIMKKIVIGFLVIGSLFTNACTVSAQETVGVKTQLNADSNEIEDIITGIFGTVPWTWNEDKQVLTFEGGEFPATNNKTNIRKTIEQNPLLEGNEIKKIVFTKPIKADKNSSYLFSYLKNLKVIENSHFLDTSDVADMSYMFESSDKITGLDLSKWDTSNVNNMSFMFDRSRGLVNVNVSNWDTSSVTDMYGMFYRSNSLVNIKGISEWDTSNVTDMSVMFHSAASLVSLDLSNWNTSNVTDTSFMFSNTSRLTTLNLANWDTSSVIYMDSMFYNNSSSLKVDFSNWDAQNIIETGYQK